MANQRHALLIGVAKSPRILEHPCFRIRDGYHPLSSDQDVDLMRELLVGRFGFPAENTRTLKTEQATIAAILSAVEELTRRVDEVDDAGEADVVVLYYSGHGSRMRDPKNPQAMRETIVPYDSGRDEGPEWKCELVPERCCKDVRSLGEVPEKRKRCGPRAGRGEQGSDYNRDIPDLEIDRWVRRLNDKTPYVTLIFDCCHSGSATRDPFGLIREAVADPRPADQMFEDGQVPAMFAGSRGPEEKRMRSGWLPLVGRRAVMVASCHRSELSWQRRHTAHGLLTYHLHSALSELDREATWADVLEWVDPKVRAERATQNPQFEGEIDRQIFGKKTARASPYLPVEAADLEGVDLGGGEAQGVSRGTLWTVRAHGTRRRQAGVELARVRIERLRATTCRGRVVAGEADLIEAGQRAFLLEQNLPEPGLKVVVVAPRGRRLELSKVLEESKLLAVVAESGDDDDDPPEAGDVVIRCLAPREKVDAGDPCSALGPLPGWTWAMVGRDGRLQARPRPASRDGVQRLQEDLVRLARFEGLRRLNNPDPESRLCGRVDLRIVRRSGPARDDDREGMVVVEEGDKVDFEIENRYHRDVRVSLVEFASDHSITVLMPRQQHFTYRRGGKKLKPGEILRVGRDYYSMNGGLEPLLPDGFPWSVNEGQGQDVGVSHFKLMATLAKADFEFLEQENVRYVPRHPLERLGWLYYSSLGKRAVTLPADEEAEDQDWTVVTSELGIRRRLKR